MPAKNQVSSLKTKLQPEEVTLVPGPMKTLISWKAPVRPFKKRSREYFSTIAAIAFLLSIILLFLKEWLLIGVIISVMFLGYVLATIPPAEVSHKITSRGIKTGKKMYRWNILNRFWFSKKLGQEILNVETSLVFPGQLQLILKDIDKDQLKKNLAKYLVAEKPPKTFLDKTADWLQKKVPLEE